MKSLIPTRRKDNYSQLQLLFEKNKTQAPSSSSTTTLPEEDEGQDLFSRLPTELTLLIFHNLVVTDSVSDILSALEVCRSWRAILLSPEIWTPLAEVLFPGFVSHVRASSSSSPDESRTTTAVQELEGISFYRALRIHHLRATGIFNRATHTHVRLHDGNATTRTDEDENAPVPVPGVFHSVNQVSGLVDIGTDEDHYVSRIKLYSHGRVAWWPEAWHLPFFAVVDDLWKREGRRSERKMYIFPGQEEVQKSHRARRGGWKTSLGEVLFVMAQEELGVCVWHLERDEMKMVTAVGGGGLPLPAFDRCVVQGERLLFVGRSNGQVWLWDWESSTTKTVDVARLGCYAPGPVRMGGQMVLGLGFPPTPRPPPKVGLRLQDTDVKVDFILHPTCTERDVLFVLTWDEVDLMAWEISSGEVTARVVCPHGDLAYRIMQLSRTNNTVHYLRSEPCDAFGGYCLMTAWIEFGDDPICDGPCEFTGGSLGSVCFNVYTKTFSAFVHHASCQRTPDAHLWDGLLALAVAGSKKHDNNDKDIKKKVVALLEPCDDGKRGANKTVELGATFTVRTMTPGLLETDDDQAAVVPFTLAAFDPNDIIGPRVQSLQGMAYALEAGGGGGGGEGAGLDVGKAEWLSGDERTLIYVAGKEYTVWTFGEGRSAERIGMKEARVAWRDRLRSVLAGVVGHRRA